MRANIPTIGKAGRRSSNPWNFWAGLLGLLLASARGEDWPDLRSVPADLVVPPLSETAPAPGLRVKQRLPAYEGTQIHHVLYLPTDWTPARKFPVLVEYAGNGGFSNRFGDVSTGVPEQSNLGYGISGGRGFIWLCVPYVQTGRTEICRRWWGDVPATLDYCREAVKLVSERYGGDPAAVILTGFSRGAIGCGYLGLHNDEIAKLWRAFIPFSHYDGVDRFPYEGSDAASAIRRMQRLNGRPSFICHEGSVERTKAFVAQSGVSAPFTFQVVPFRNHNDEWALRPSPARTALRAWLDEVLAAPPAGRDFAAELVRLAAGLRARVPAGGPTESQLDEWLRDPGFASPLARWQLIRKTGAKPLGDFAAAAPDHARFLDWLLGDAAALRLYLETAVPLGLAARERDDYALSVEALSIWSRIHHADPESQEGLPLRLAIATALRPPGAGAPGAGQRNPPVDPLARYQHVKQAWRAGALFPSFERLTAWELQFVVSSGASDEDLAWARELINTWRPDLRDGEQVVNSTSEVWRRNSPHPYTDYPSVLSGGGKCGPRSSWSVMVCQAFGIPAIGVGQPAHACVAYKAADPAREPQPGSAWKVADGRGWEVSRLEGLSGPDFLAGVAERSRAEAFSRVEQLRWLAAALASREQAVAVQAVAQRLQRAAPVEPTDLGASAKADEAEREGPTVAAAPETAAREPVRLAAGTNRIDAAAHAARAGVRVLGCFTGGRQVNFDKNLESSWIEYALEVPASGGYSLALRAAAPNDDQVLQVAVDGQPAGSVKIPNTAGRWGGTTPVEIALEKGARTLRLSAPYQRGVAVRWLELMPR